MILILYPSSHRYLAEEISNDLENAFSGHIDVHLTDSAAPGTWPGDPFWDDLIVLLYDADTLAPTGQRFLAEYRRQRANGFILPVALDLTKRRPPAPIEGVKALEFGAPAMGINGRVVNRVGCMLGLRVQGRDSKIFVSYRAADGKAIAEQVFAHLESTGHTAWLDEAREIDGDTKVLPGTEVQGQINDALSNANLLLLMDTPLAPASPWIKHEIDTADSLLLPILPICFRPVGDRTKGPRFRSLLALQRWVEMEAPDPALTSPLRADVLDHIVSEVDTYLCEIFKRKFRIPFIVENDFRAHGYGWKVLDNRLMMFESSRSHQPRLVTTVVSHCSLFDKVYGPALQRFGNFLRNVGKSNYSLFIYGGDLLPEVDLREMAEAQNDPVIILHHQELATLISSDFTKLAMA